MPLGVQVRSLGYKPSQAYEGRIVMQDDENGDGHEILRHAASCVEAGAKLRIQQIIAEVRNDPSSYEDSASGAKVERKIASDHPE
jgi:hypothetical protein